jgi:hypothetical protein
MDVPYCLKELNRNAAAILELFSGIDDDQARWHPAAGKWSLLEIAFHLADEEREDFRVRIESIWSGTPAPPIDPEGWVTSRAYNDGKLQDALTRFSKERSDSIKWLMKSADADWSAEYAHPEVGRITTADLLASWVAHDLLHVRQIVRTKLQYFEQHNRGISTKYAGQW